jgi:hypothetical protein
VAFSSGEYVATFAAASTLGGYSSGSAADPVEAIEAALKASPAKPARVSKPNMERTYKEGGFSEDWTAP